MIRLPYNYEPRIYQLPILDALDSGIKRAVAVWHRRSGKDKTLLNYTIKRSFQDVGTYYHLFPTYAQGKKILWDGIDGDGFKVMGHFPAALIDGKPNETELKVRLRNGSVWQIIGTDNCDSIVGTNPIGCVFSEFALQDPTAWSLIRPILRENGGWAAFDFTPRGRNHGFDLYNMARLNPDWFCQMLTVNDTRRPDGSPVISPEDIEVERREGMPEELVQQEYYCSFEAGVVGSYYGQQIAQARQDSRITVVPWIPSLPVHTAWDLGVGDTTAIWFYQQVGAEVRFLDCYEASGEGLAHYAKVIQARPYVYGSHYAPHDIEVRELGTGKSRRETARGLGIEFKVVPKLPIDDGIQAARGLLSRAWFDEAKCADGLNALASYHKEFDEKRRQFKDTPYHDWSSNYADAMRYAAVSLREPVKPKPGWRDRRKRQGVARWVAT